RRRRKKRVARRLLRPRRRRRAKRSPRRRRRNSFARLVSLSRDGSVKLIVGLGNPGIEYQFTPHNIGFMVVDRIASERGVEIRNRQCRALTARIQVGDEQVLLAKPETYMNLSGMSVRELVAEYEASPKTDLIVVQDELDF